MLLLGEKLFLSQNFFFLATSWFCRVRCYVVLSKSMCISAFGPSSSHSHSFIILFIHSAFSLYIYWLLYFRQISFGFFCIELLVSFRGISFVILECPVLSVCFTLCRYLFNLPSFTRTFWFISSSCYFFLCSLFLFVPTYSSVFQLFYHFRLFS